MKSEEMQVTVEAWCKVLPWLKSYLENKKISKISCRQIDAEILRREQRGSEHRPFHPIYLLDKDGILLGEVGEVVVSESFRVRKVLWLFPFKHKVKEHALYKTESVEKAISRLQIEDRVRFILCSFNEEEDLVKYAKLGVAYPGSLIRRRFILASFPLEFSYVDWRASVLRNWEEQEESRKREIQRQIADSEKSVKSKLAKILGQE